MFSEAGAPAYRAFCEGWGCSTAGDVHQSQKPHDPPQYSPLCPGDSSGTRKPVSYNFITFGCYHRAPLLGTAHARDTFLSALERVRRWNGFYVVGYVVMPEHVHLLISEPESGSLALALQTMKQIVSRALRQPGVTKPFWQARYYDFNVWSDRERVEKLRYLHRNPVKRRLVDEPEDWPWSSFRHYLTGAPCPVKVESPWTARRREHMGIFPKVSRRALNENPQPSQKAR